MFIKSIEDDSSNFTRFEGTGLFQGYASVFNVVDYAGDVILPGAFSGRVYKNIKLLWQHEHKTPIGIIDEMYDDGKGLFVDGRIFLALEKGREAHILIQNQVTDHLSVGYEVIDSYYKDNIRYITKVNLWEVSVVTFPANKLAEITNIKELQQLDERLNKAINILRMVGDSGLEPLTPTMST